MSVMRIIALIYLVLLAVYFGFQTRVIFPGAETQGQPFAKLRPPSGCELVTLATPRAEQVVAIYGPALRPTDGPIPRRLHARP